MAKEGSGTAECPKSKRYLSGTNAGDIIRVTVYENGKGICPEARDCTDVCLYNTRKKK